MMLTHRSTVLSFASSLLFVACGGGGSGDSSGDVSGQILFVAESPLTIGDAEPNDSVDTPQVAGDIEANREVRIQGELDAATDAIDSYSFTAKSRVAVSATLTFAGGASREFQCGVFDPVAMQLVQRGTPGASRSSARFHARGAFDIVVRAAHGAGHYTLVVRAEAANEPIERGGWLGDLVVGESMKLSSVSGAAWSATSAEALTLTVRAPTGGVVRVRDLASGTETVVAGGEQHIEVAALAPIQFTTEGSADFAFDVSSTEPSASSMNRLPVRVAELERERAAWNVTADARLYGAAQLEAVPGQLLVRARAGRSIAAECARRSCVVRDVIPGIADVVEFELPPALDAAERSRATLALARSFATSNDVEYAELNLIRHALGGAVTPNDGFNSLQWHYPLIKLPQAWGAFTGTTDVIVAVIDTGERAHVDLNANLVAGFDFISSSTIAADGDGRDPDPFDVGDGEGPTPSSFHGTHVAGTIAAVTNNTVGVSGVCGPDNHTKIMHLRVLGKGGGTDADIAQAILYAARLANASGTLPPVAARVINMSLGGPGSTSSVQNAINAANTAGVSIFAAAGNNNSSVAFFPASYNHVVSVSAVDIQSNKAPYSNFNASVDICAPGGDTSVDLNGDSYPDGVLSTLVNESTSAPIYVFYQGTSMACPHAAGVAALLRSQSPVLTPAQVESILKTTAVDLGAVGQDPIYGAGLIDAYEAVVTAGAPPLAGVPTLGVSPPDLAFGSQLTTLSFQVSNLGGGMLDVGTISSNAPWLTAVGQVSAGTTSDIGSVLCTVDRTGLAAGNFSAAVTVFANNGSVPSLSVDITMTVVPVPVVVNVDLFVLAVNADTLETVQQVTVNPTTGLAYEFIDLPAGNYLLVCGSDEDTSDGICGPNDVYCGLYPTVNDPEVVTISGGNLSGYNFVVGPNASTGLVHGAAHRTYARLTH